MSARAGVTLIEVLVALTISALCLTLALGAGSRVAGSRHAAHGLSTQALHAAMARGLLTDLLTGMIVNDGSARLYATDDSAAGVPDDRLQFVTRHPPTRAAASAHVTLHIDREERTRELGLIASIAIPGQSVRKLELDKTAIGLSIEYRAQEGNEWIHLWDRTTSPPAAVRLVLEHGRNAVPRVRLIPIIVVLEPEAT